MLENVNSEKLEEYSAKFVKSLNKKIRELALNEELKEDLSLDYERENVECVFNLFKQMEVLSLTINKSLYGDIHEEFYVNAIRLKCKSEYYFELGTLTEDFYEQDDSNDSNLDDFENYIQCAKRMVVNPRMNYDNVKVKTMMYSENELLYEFGIDKRKINASEFKLLFYFLLEELKLYELLMDAYQDLVNLYEEAIVYILQSFYGNNFEVDFIHSNHYFKAKIINKKTQQEIVQSFDDVFISLI